MLPLAPAAERRYVGQTWMARIALSVLRHLHRSLAYQRLPELIGKHVQIQSTSSAATEVVALARRSFEFEVKSQRDDLFAMFARYGVLDLEYGIDNIGCSIDRPGLGALRELGLVDSPPDEDGLRESDLMPDFLEDLAAQVDLGTIHLKVFLEAPEVHARGGIPSQSWTRSKIIWPQQLLVVDACITNASKVWLAKHFYL